MDKVNDVKSGDPREAEADGDGKFDTLESGSGSLPLNKSSFKMSVNDGDLSSETLVAIVEAVPLTNGEEERREDDALDGAVSILGIDLPDGIVNWVRFGYAADDIPDVLFTGGLRGDIHNEGGMLI